MSKKNHSIESNNYTSAFLEAECFLNVSKLIRERSHIKKYSHPEIDRTIHYQYARHVNHAYAFELYLKCLMIIDNGSYVMGHGLLDLYSLLKEDLRNSIEKRYTSGYILIRRHSKYLGLFETPTVNDLLTEANKAFIDSRYLFSGHTPPQYELDGLLECVRQEIITIKPELQNLW